MTTIQIRTSRTLLSAAAAAAIGLAFLLPGQASAGNTDGPWPEPPSCSHSTGTCTSIEDQLAYECFFEEDDFPIQWCDDPFDALNQGTLGLAAESPTPEPSPVRLAIPAARR